MKIVRLEAENIKRIEAIEITPKGDVVTIGGKNGAGKSSVLDSIAYALGGQALVPAEPLRSGELTGHVTVDLGDYVVTRKFSRDKLDTSTAGQPSHTFGPIRSTLTVANKEGAKYGSPQALLDKLVGKLTFDPFAFTRMAPRQQRETLRTLVGLDFSALDDEKDATASALRDVQREATHMSETVKRMPEQTGVPDVEISMDEVSQQMLAAEEARVIVSRVQRELDKFNDETTACARQRDELDIEINDVQKRLEQLQSMFEDAVRQHATATARVASLELELERAQAAVPDTAAIRARITEIEQTNENVRVQQARRNASERLKERNARAEELRQRLKAIDAEKLASIAAAPFPVEGLGFTDDGITFGGIPFEQASTSEQIKVSMAIGLKLNPALKVVFIRDGSLLDDEAMVSIATLAHEADAQVWVERVTGNGDDVQVFIEDGNVA